MTLSAPFTEEGSDLSPSRWSAGGRAGPQEPTAVPCPGEEPGAATGGSYPALGLWRVRTELAGKCEAHTEFRDWVVVFLLLEW